MRPSFLIILPVIFATQAFGVISSPLQVVAHQAELTLLVKDEEIAMSRLVEAAVASGGYLKLRKPGRIVMRIPTERFETYLQTAKDLGTLGERKLLAQDLSADRERLTAELTSSETMLKQYLTTLAGATTRNDLAAFQTATSDLIGKIEERRGTLANMDHNGRYAQVDVVFQMRQRAPVRVDQSTSFPWLRSIDVNELLSDFAKETP